MIRRLILAAAILAAPLVAAAPASASSRPSSWLSACRWSCWRSPSRADWHFVYSYTKVDQYGDRVSCNVYWDWTTDTLHEECR